MICGQLKSRMTCTRKLIARQGPNGEWPWFFDAASGLVVDFYEVYSVHQCGMAPAFLERAEQHGVSEARSAIIKGFNWILGQNQLAMPMLVPELHLTIRSQVRKGELYSKKWRVLRALGNSLLGREAGLIDPADLEIRRECRSYELGWILWSFGQRSDLPELTHNEMFIERSEKAIPSSRGPRQYHHERPIVAIAEARFHTTPLLNNNRLIIL